VVGVILPCHSDPSRRGGRAAGGRALRHPDHAVDLAPCFDRLLEDLTGAMRCAAFRGRTGPAGDPEARMAAANLKPRLRMTSVYFLANALNYLVAGTGNRSELTIGYFTKHGDGGVDLLPIGRLLKSEVRDLARDSACRRRSSRSRRAPGCGPGRPTRMGFDADRASPRAPPISAERLPSDHKARRRGRAGTRLRIERSSSVDA
jgi:hypothetical protein